MENGPSYDRKARGFLWGTVFTWALSVPFIIAIIPIFATVHGAASEQKAVGLGAIVPGAEVYTIFRLILALLLAVVAIVMLIRSFSSGHQMRALVSLLYIGWNAVMLLGATGLFVGLIVIIHQTHTMR